MHVLCTMTTVHARTMIIVHAYTVIIVGACAMIIAHVCPTGLVFREIKGGDPGDDALQQNKGGWRAASPPMVSRARNM